MYSAVVIFTAILSLKSLEAVAYGHYPYAGPHSNNPVFDSSSGTNYAMSGSRPLRDSDFSSSETMAWKRDLFYSRRPGIHGPQIDTDASNFRPPGRTQSLHGGGEGFARPSLQNSVGRQRQLGSNFGSRPNLFLPPAADDPDDIFIFDRPTSPNSRPLTTPSSTTTTTVENCDCPSTPEFNPVCGSDGITYTNPGKLKCAIFCGTVVSLKHRGSCFATTSASPPVTSTS